MSTPIYVRLDKLTHNGIYPKDAPALREICSKLSNIRVVNLLVIPLLDAIEAADNAALFALASLGDTEAVLELGHFGKMTTRDAILKLQAFRAGLLRKK